MLLAGLLVLVGYLLGAIPFGFLLGLASGIDIRRYGSGNTGATNTLRALGPKASAAVFVLDVAKAVLPTVLARVMIGDPLIEAFSGLAAVVGHNWPVYLRWKGGKGVSSSLGVMAVLAPIPTAAGFIIAVPLIAWSRFVSLGSITGAIVIPIFTAAYSMLFGQLPWPYVAVSFVLGVLVVFRHTDNIHRLLSGTERKLGEKAMPGLLMDRPELRQR